MDRLRSLHQRRHNMMDRVTKLYRRRHEILWQQRILLAHRMKVEGLSSPPLPAEEAERFISNDPLMEPAWAHLRRVHEFEAQYQMDDTSAEMLTEAAEAEKDSWVPLYNMDQLPVAR